MEVLPSDKQNLEKLLDVFGSVVSLQDIASAYCQSGRDLAAAGEILFNLHRMASKASPSTSGEELESADKSPEELESADNSPSNDSLEKANHSKLKQKRVPASMGTVSSIIGKDYVRPRPSTTEFCKAKPLKLNSSDIPMSEIWDEKDGSNSTLTSEILHKDIVEFLFKMLGDGFQLERSVIQDIVGQCGYDVNKSMEKLLNLSASALENSTDIMKPTKNFLHLEYMQQDDQFPDAGSSGSSTYTLKDGTLQYPNKEENYDLCKETFLFSVPEKSKEREKSGIIKQVWKQKASDVLIEEPLNETAVKRVTKNESQLPDGKDVSDLQKEVLGSLFCVSERLEKKPEKTRPVRGVSRQRVHGQLVEGPLKETTIEYEPVITRVQAMKDDDEENRDDYEVLRKAVMKHWSTMKVYYKSAADAFVKQDHERAQKLLNEGHFFMEKALEAEERSAQMLLGRNVEEDMFVDVHDHDPKLALRLLKVQLVSLPGISSFKHLKVLAGSNDENSKHGLRKRMIIKFLNRENIRWKEEGDGWTIVIPLADIDPKKLSFSKT